MEPRPGDETKPLGELAESPYPSSALDPWAPRLHRDDGSGDLLLFNKGTDKLVLRQDMGDPAFRRGRTRSRSA
jgi:hypothetical protein